ncbi:hypothetical protein KR059_011435 [Drosophila kikkawai]|nr:hypothetical protein KR059_011435 [Drosophila kikkawai]
MDLEFPDIDIDHLLDTTTALEDGFLAPYKQIPMPKINARVKEKRTRLAERIAQGDELIRQVKQLQLQNKKLTDLQRTAQEVTDLYQKEKQQRLELQKKSQQLGDRCAELEKELDAQVIIGENLQEELEKRALPVDAKEVLGILLQLEQRLGDDAGLVRRDQNIVKKLKDYCKTANISMPTPKSPSPRNKRRSQATQTDAGPVPEKPILCSVAVQVENLIQTRDQSMQFKATTTTRGTTTASFIKKCHVGTTFPEPKPMPNVQQILDEMLSWRDEPLGPLSPLCDFPLEVEEQHMPATVSVATSTTLCNIHREIDFISEVPPQIKVSASRPPSRTMLDSVKEEARSSRELAKELLNFLPQNQSCLANLPPQAFEELWQVFGQMVLGLLQRRPSPPTVSQADFTRWLYELYEGTQCQPEENSSNSASKKGKIPNKIKSVSGLIQSTFLLDFSASTECMDVGLDPIIASPNISHGGDITPIRLPPKPKERKRKSKKRQAAASLIKPIAKRTCQEMKPAEDHPGNTQESVKLVKEQEPETAIQFLSNLNTFNMANCDNLDNMELDEEEMYLLQLTSKVTRQAEQEQATEGECVSHFPTLPKVLANTDDSQKESNLCEKQLPSEETDSDLNSEKVFSDQEHPAFITETIPEVDKNVYSSDSDSEDYTMQSVTGSLLDSNSCKSNKSKGRTLVDSKRSISYLFGSDSESEASEQQLPKEDTESEEDVSESESEIAETKTSFMDSEEEFNRSDSDSSEQKLPKEDTELDAAESEEDLSLSESEASEQELLEDVTKWSSIALKDDLNRDSNSDLQKKEKLLSTQISSPALSSNDDSEDEDKLVIDAELPPSIASKDSPSTVTSKRKRTLSEIKSPPTPGEGRLTRQRAKQMLLEEKSQTENRISLVEQIRRQLQQALDKSEPLRRDPAPAKAVKQFQQTLSKLEPLKTDPAPAKSVEKFQPAVNKSAPPKGIYSPDPAKSKKNPDEPPPEESFGSYEESPASPCAEPLDDNVDSIPEIPLEQPKGLQYDGQPKSIIEHVIDEYKAQPKLSQLRRKTLGKSQQKLCSSIGKYLEESLDLEDFSLEVYKLTKDEAVIVNALVVVITKMGIDGNPLQRLISALNYFKFMPRFLAELEERLFRNTKERPPTELAMKYVKLYLEAVSDTARVTQEYTNPARLLLAKLLYHYEQDMPETVLAVLRQFPTVLPHREERQYDHSDPLITVIKHLLMSRTYDMQDPDGAERLLLSKLRFEYHFQPFEPSKQQVLENLVEKLKAGRSLEQLGYAFALFCRRSPHLKVVDLVTEHLMPLATSYCDLAQDESYDDRLVAVLQCISMVLKPLPLDTDISALVGLVKRLIVAVPRPGVQQAAVQACLRLQRFGFQTIRDALQNYRPKYPLDPLTRAMLRCFAERRKQYHILATKGICARK